MDKYCIRLKQSEKKELTKENFLRALRLNDTGFVLDPEGNPVTVWVTTSLPMKDLFSFEEVEDVIEATEETKNEIEDLVGESFEDMGIDEGHLYD